MYLIGVDIGASKVAAALVTKGRFFAFKKYKYRTRKHQKTIQTITACIDAVKKNKKIAGIGVGVPCALGERRKKLACANISGFDPQKLHAILIKRYRVPVVIENDVKAMAGAELWGGIGVRVKNFVFVALGTGIGGAIVINGGLYKGKGWAGEFGHTIVNFKSGNQKSKILNTWEGISTKQFLKSKKTPRDVKQFAEAVSIGLLNITYALSPEAIVIGGGLSSLWKHGFETALKAAMRKNHTIRSLPLPKIIRSRFGEKAGVLGAALLLSRSSSRK